MADLLSVVVLYSLIFVILLSLGLFGFIVARRLVLGRRDALFEARYLLIEREVLEAIASGDRKMALEVGARYSGQPRTLTPVLVDMLEVIGGENREVLRVIFDRALRERCVRDLGSLFAARRLKAIRLAGLLSSAPEKTLLVELLRDKPIVRLAAVNSLVRFQDRESLALVFKAFEQESCPNVHTYTNILFGAGERTEPFIRDCLAHPPSVEKLRLLINLAAAIPLPSLFREIAGLAGHPEMEVRIAAAKALSRFRLPDSLGILSALAEDPAWQVQAQALKGLGRLKNPEALSLLSRGLHSPNWHVRNNARQGLLDLGPAGLERLRAVSLDRTDRFASDMAAMGLEDLTYRMAG